MLEAPTWRANPDWAAIVGYDAAALDRVNRAAIELLHGLREKYLRELGLTDVKVGGLHGPRGDGYVAGEDADPDEAAAYHSAQARSAAAAGAELVTALTLTGAGEAIGFVRAVRDTGLPVAVGFTVETDGRLPDGTTLKDAIGRVDAAAPPDYYVVNCAHPTHVAPALEGGRALEPDRGPAPQRQPDVARRAGRRRRSSTRATRPTWPSARTRCAPACRTCGSSAAAAAPTAATSPRCGASADRAANFPAHPRVRPDVRTLGNLIAVLTLLVTGAVSAAGQARTPSDVGPADHRSADLRRGGDADGGDRRRWGRRPGHAAAQRRPPGPGPARRPGPGRRRPVGPPR